MHTTSINRTLTLAGFIPAGKPGNRNQARRRVAALILLSRRLGMEPGSGGKLFARVAVVCLCFLFAVGTPAQQSNRPPRFTTIDAPGAGNNTLPFGINALGAIVGYYLDAANVYHGFLRTPNGAFTKIDAPGASTGPYEGTIAMGLNIEGAVTGYYFDSSVVSHGYVRAPNGGITTFDAVAPAGLTGSQGTFSVAISLGGTIAGFYVDATNVTHGFVRSPSGAITTFDPVGSLATYTAYFSAFNPEGAITGWYSDSSGVNHGYVRARDGGITTFDAGAGAGLNQGTISGSINLFGVTTGLYLDATNVYHGFVRYPGGAVTMVNVPGAGTGAYQIGR